MKFLKSLTREQKEAVGLLQIGTFLEYFDLMLYVHMAVLLNELFFPKTDPHTASLIAAFAFCSTYVLRPFGALIFGYIGDNIGRKTTVIITTMMMATSCIIMANLPTYAQIGVTAAWVVTICRLVQGLSSMGEIIGAQIYVAEITKPPAGYTAVSLINLASAFGSMGALGIGALTTAYGFNWRTAFWIGACIAVVGSVARTRLRETPEFLNMKRVIKSQGKKHIIKEVQDTINPIALEDRSFLNSLNYFFVYCGWPLIFYLVYIYFNPTLKSVYGYTAENIIFHNFLLTMVQVISTLIWTALSYRFYPLTILKIRAFCSLFLMASIPICLSINPSVIYVFLLQALILTLHIGELPASYIFIKKFPVDKRFTFSSFLYASARALMYVVTSFGVVYVTEAFNHWGLLLVTVPSCLAFLAGVRHFEKLEKASISSVDGAELRQVA